MMSDRAVISVHTKPEVSQRLDELAALTRRSKSYLANEAIERYLQDEEEYVASVRRGVADADAGRLFTTDDVRERLQAHVAGRAAKV